MELHLVIEGRKDLSGHVHRQLADAIRSGRLADGQQVPPSRLLAQRLGISRKPVAEAYTRLTYNQLLVGRIGNGSFVCAPVAAAMRRATRAEPAGHATLRRCDGMHAPLRHPLPEGRSRYEFIGGSPSPQLFPLDEWRRCVLRGPRQESRAPGLARYAPAEGLPELREAIARHARYARGVAGCARRGRRRAAGIRPARQSPARTGQRGGGGEPGLSAGAPAVRQPRCAGGGRTDGCGRHRVGPRPGGCAPDLRYAGPPSSRSGCRRAWRAAKPCSCARWRSARFLCRGSAAVGTIPRLRRDRHRAGAAARARDPAADGLARTAWPHRSAGRRWSLSRLSFDSAGRPDFFSSGAGSSVVASSRP